MTVIMWYSRLLLGVALLQIYAAGIGLFGAGSFKLHAILGWVFMLLALIMVIVVLIAGRRASLVTPAAAILVLSISQPFLAFWARENVPAVAALHPVAGVLIVLSVLAIERGSRRRRGSSTGRQPETLSTPAAVV